MNNQGASNDNIHLGDTTVFGDLEVKEEFKIDGDIVVDPPACLKTDCIKPTTASGQVDIKNSSGSGIASFYDDQSIGAISIFGNSGGLLLSSDDGGQAVLDINQGLGIYTAGVRLLNTKLNVNEIQSQSHDTGDNPKVLFTASKVEITGDNPIDFETKSILTTEIKKDSSGGNMIVKASDGTQLLRSDENLKEVYIGEDADGWQLPKLRNTIGHVLTMSNTGISTFEELPQTGANTLIGAITVPRTIYGAGNWASIATSYSGSTSIAANTWDIGDVLRVKISGTYDHNATTSGTAFLRFKLGALLTITSNDIYPSSNSTSFNHPFEFYLVLTRTGTTDINWVGQGSYFDFGDSTVKEITFGRGTLATYNAAATLPVDFEFQDNSVSGAGDGYLYYICQSGVWIQSTPSSVVPVISTTDHTALSNLELGDAGHSQFALLAGRSTGQVLDGGLIAGETLQVRSNAAQPTDAISFLSPLDMSGTVNMNQSEIAGVQNITANTANGNINFSNSVGGPYLALGNGASNEFNSSFKDINMNGFKIYGTSVASGDLKLESTSDGTKGQIICSDELAIPDGAIANPSLTFSSDLTAGMSRDTASGGLVFSTAGTEKVSIEKDAAMLITHQAGADNDHGLEIDYNAMGFADGQALEVVYTTGVLAAGEEDDAILVSVDKLASTGGEVIGYSCLSTTGSAETYGVEAGVDVNPLIHLSGGFGNPSVGLVNAVDELANFINVGVNTSIFVADNNTITIGKATTFSEIEVVLTTGASGGGITPTFEYSTGVGTWQTFSPTDSTNGMRNTGILAWLVADVGSWAVSGSDYLIRITRTKNSLSTTPVASLVQVASATVYSWDKDAKLTVNTVSASGNISAANFGQDANNNLFIGEITDPAPSGSNNVAIGTGAGDNMAAADSSVIIGVDAGRDLTDGLNNVAIGKGAGRLLTTGTNNTFVGEGIVFDGSSGGLTGSNNTAVGGTAMRKAGSSANANSCLGFVALNNLSTGYNNVAMGYQAGNVITTGFSNTLIGYDTDVSAAGGFNRMALGNGAIATADNQCMIGNSAMTEIVPNSGATCNLGSAANTFEDLYLAGDMIQESPMIEAYHHLTSSSLTTTSATPNTPIALNVDSDMLTTHNQDITCSTAGVITYTGSRTRLIDISANLTASVDKKSYLHLWLVSSNTTRYPSFPAHDSITFTTGSVPASIVSFQYEPQTLDTDSQAHIRCFVEMETNDTLTLYVASDTSTTAITVNHLTINCHGLSNTLV